jgi:hypothetical protein
MKVYVIVEEIGFDNIEYQVLDVYLSEKKAHEVADKLNRQSTRNYTAIVYPTNLVGDPSNISVKMNAGNISGNVTGLKIDSL